MSCNHKDRLLRVEPLFKSETSFSFGSRIRLEKSPPLVPPTAQLALSDVNARSDRIPFHCFLLTRCHTTTSTRTRVRLFPCLASERHREIAAVNSVWQGKDDCTEAGRKRMRPGGAEVVMWLRRSVGPGEEKKTKQFGSDPTHQKAFSPTSRVISKSNPPTIKTSPVSPRHRSLIPEGESDASFSPFVLFSGTFLPLLPSDPRGRRKRPDLGIHIWWAYRGGPNVREPHHVVALYTACYHFVISSY